MKFIRKKINEGFENPFEDTVIDTLSDCTKSPVTPLL